MPSLVKYSIKIISDAGLGMAMFSLGISIMSFANCNHSYIARPNIAHYMFEKMFVKI